MPRGQERERKEYSPFKKMSENRATEVKGTAPDDVAVLD